MAAVMLCYTIHDIIVYLIRRLTVIAVRRQPTEGSSLIPMKTNTTLIIPGCAVQPYRATLKISIDPVCHASRVSAWPFLLRIFFKANGNCLLLFRQQILGYFLKLADKLGIVITRTRAAEAGINFAYITFFINNQRGWE